MSRVPDAAAREDALDPGRSFIVKAPAGSGKTSLLVARYLALLGTCQRPEEVLAITFTRKATAEMRARVLEALAGADAPPSGDPWSRRVQGLAAAVMARDAERGWQLREDPRRLSIQTIDSLCATLARRLPVVSGLGGVLAATEDPRPLYRGAARRTLAMLEDEDLGPAVVRTLTHLDGNITAFENLLAEMLGRRDQWMRYLHMVDPVSRRADLEAGLGAVVQGVLRRTRAALARSCGEEAMALGAFAAFRAQQLGISPGMLPLADTREFPGTGRGDLAAWKALSELLLTAAGDLRRRPLAKVFSAKETRDEYDAMKALLDRLDEEAGLAPGVAPALAAVRGLPDPVYDDAQWATLMDLFQVLRLAVAGLRLEFAQSASSDFAELVAGASQALGDEQRPTDLALALDYRFRHLLVDEFQDTSAAHYEILGKLTAGWSPEDGHSLFLVGDPMQSIYRFREAEVGLFLECFSGQLNGLPLVPLTLTANFRSRSGIVEWVNRVFPQVLPAEDDPVRAAVAYEASVATRDALDGEAVTVHAARDEDAERQAARVAEVVRSTRERMPESGIAILLRARTQAPPIIAALRARGLAWRGVDLEPLFRVPAVADLHALSCALLHPMDRVSWLAVLRAPWCGLRLDDLEALAGDAPKQPVTELLARDAHFKRLSADAQVRLSRVAPVLLEAVSRVGQESVSRLLARTWRALGGPACLDGARLEDARRYLALVAQAGADAALPDPDELARRAEDLYASAQPGPVDVEIMTIHKAKGLEFDVVLLPGLQRLPARDRGSLLAWSEIATPHGPRLLLAPMPPPEGEAHSPLHAFVRREERDKRERETARLFYVACTRARERLHLFASVGYKDDGPRPPPADSLLSCAWRALAGHFQGLEESTQSTNAAVRPVAGIARVPGGWSPPPPPPALAPVPHAAAESSPGVEFSWAGHTARQVGIVAHALLRRVSEDGPGAWAGARLEQACGIARDILLGSGIPAGEIEAATAAVADAVTRTLADPRGQWLLDPAHPQARSEYALTGVVDGVLVHGVVDRTFVDAEGVRWIVDYKTGTHGGGSLDEFLDREQVRYQLQLQRYATLMHSLDPRPTRLALYFPAMGGWRSWSAESLP